MLKIVHEKGVVLAEAALALGIILTFTQFKIISLLILLFIAARLVPFRLGFISRLVISFLLLVCLNCIVAAIAWVAHKPLGSGEIIGLYSLIIESLLLFFKPAAKNFKKPLNFFDLDDILAIILAVATVFILLIPVVTVNSENSATVGSVVMVGGDNSEHLQLLKADDINKGYSYGNRNVYNLPPADASYAQGWHFSGAFLKWVTQSVIPIGSSPSRLLDYFYAYTLLGFGLLVFMLTRFALSLELPYKNKWERLAKLATLFVCATAIAGWFIPLYGSGFEPELGALTLLLLEAMIIVEAYKHRPEKRYPYFLLAALVMSGINFTWTFLAPISMLLLIIFGVHSLIKARRRPPIYFSIIGIILFISSLFQPWVQIHYPNNSGGIDANGFVPHTTMWCLLAILLILTIATYCFYRQIKQASIVYWMAVIALAFSISLMAYQVHKSGIVHYYYFKSTYTYILLASVLLAVFVNSVFKWLLTIKPSGHPKRIYHVPLVTIIFAVVASMVFMSYRSVVFNEYYHKQVAGVSWGQASAVLSLLHENTFNGQFMVPIGSCDRGEDIRTYELAQALVYAKSSAYPKKVISVNLSSPYAQTVFSGVYKFLKLNHRTVYVVSSDQEITDRLINYLGPDYSKYLHVINEDPNPAATNAAVCPNRIV